MVKDSVDNCIITGYLLKKLNMPITETAAYKMGIINEKGQKIKAPETNEEKMAYMPLDEYVIAIKNALGSKLDIIDSSIFLQKQNQLQLEDVIKLYETEIALKLQLKDRIKDFYQTIKEAQKQGLPDIVIEKIILECLKEC
jgi:hypothetical protein